MPFRTLWTSLEELREIALAAGFSAADFDRATTECDGDLKKTAEYLQMQLLLRSTPHANVQTR